MSGKVSAVIASLALGVAVAPAGAQQAPEQSRAVVARRQNQLARQLAEARYQIGVMERVLENAVEHGASLWRDRLQVVLPAQTLLLDNARVIGYRIKEYGVVFNVEVPSLETTMTWAVRTLDQNDLGLDNALKAVRAHIQASGDANLDQAWRRVELQVAPLGTPAGRPPAQPPRRLSHCRDRPRLRLTRRRRRRTRPTRFSAIPKKSFARRWCNR